MISVAILINGNPIIARSAVNMGLQPDGTTRYEVDDGSVIFHVRHAGAVPLAIEMLKTVKEIPG